MYEKNNLESFLLSSFSLNPERMFQGYCFNKEDFIFGASGAEEYFEKTGKEISIGEDGCYVFSKKINSNYIIGSDSSGYKKILYYQNMDTGIWAVSNSLVILIKHLRENKVEITPNISSLILLSSVTAYGQQPASFKSIANEIEILPINTVLEIGPSTLKIESITSQEARKTKYQEVLIEFVSIWASRYATLLTCKDVLIEQGLTGGLDSRAIFSLANLCSERYKNEIKADFRLQSALTRGKDDDLKVAQNIASYYKYELNNKEPVSTKRKILSTEQQYLKWKNLCVGLYTPIYIPVNEIDFKKIAVGGQGGENFRAQYKRILKIDDSEDFIKILCQNINDGNYKIDLALDVYKSFLKIKEVDLINKEVDELTLHYVHFRTRFHAGLFPQYRTSFTPLSSKYLSEIMSNKNFDKLESSQIHYDLINITSDLLEIPYESKDKYPSLSNYSQLLSIRDQLSIKKGLIYVGTEFNEISKPNKSNNSVFEYMKDDLKNACESELVKKLWSSKYIEEANRSLDKAIEQGKFLHAYDGIPISVIIATGIFN